MNKGFALRRENMKVVIIEDEKPAIEKLEQMLMRYDPDIEVVGRLNSVEETVNWFLDDSIQADLVFMDIMLTDGISFDIFEQIDITLPIIFITAYNEYAIQAFKVNSIDYLLKPLDYNDLYRSLEKMKTLSANLPSEGSKIQYEDLNRVLL